MHSEQDEKKRETTTDQRLLDRTTSSLKASKVARANSAASLISAIIVICT